MEWGFPSYLSEARIAMETLFVSPFISSESWFQKWAEGRESMASLKDFGLKGRAMCKESLNEMKELVKESESPYGIRFEGDNENEMVLEWNGTPLVRVSAWM
ncbi:Transcription factor GRAS [Artemisia annua]|uniref:Transcription factor GRAS n=1 Tax=Artemisia annua TaxID=35608 RepID=A0A2U1PLZ5_ARTAN|nr:Transcription factor GRAS [Artemisia annua]